MVGGWVGGWVGGLAWEWKCGRSACQWRSSWLSITSDGTTLHCPQRILVLPCRAIWGAVQAARKRHGAGFMPHVVTTAIEHPAVLGTLASYAAQVGGWAPQLGAWLSLLVSLEAGKPGPGTALHLPSITTYALTIRPSTSTRPACSCLMQGLLGSQRRQSMGGAWSALQPLCPVTAPITATPPWQGLLEFTAVPVDCEGLVSVAAVEGALRPATVLLTVMHSNNEVGVGGGAGGVNVGEQQLGARAVHDCEQTPCCMRGGPF